MILYLKPIPLNINFGVYVIMCHVAIFCRKYRIIQGFSNHNFSLWPLSVDEIGKGPAKIVIIIHL